MILKPKIKPIIKIMGIINHPKKTMRPAKNTKISAKRPIIIKKLLIIAPRKQKIRLAKNTSKYLPMSKPRP
jgi:hypothetical protein